MTDLTLPLAVLGAVVIGGGIGVLMMRRRRAREATMVFDPSATLAPSPGPSPSTAGFGLGGGSGQNDLEQLRAPHEKGALSAEEYEAAKGRLLTGERAQRTYEAVLVRTGENKISVIKQVRDLTRLGLAEAKHAVENEPFTLGRGLSADQAAKIERDFAAVGARVELR